MYKVKIIGTNVASGSLIRETSELEFNHSPEFVLCINNLRYSLQADKYGSLVLPMVNVKHLSIGVDKFGNPTVIFPHK